MGPVQKNQTTSFDVFAAVEAVMASPGRDQGVQLGALAPTHNRTLNQSHYTARPPTSQLVIREAELLTAHHQSPGLDLCPYSRSDGMALPEFP